MIEHDEAIREIIRYILEDAGWQVLQAEAPYKPEALARSGADLALIDE